MTQHALDRWRERCHGLDPETEWLGARRVGQKMKKKIKAACPKHRILMTRLFRGFYYLISRNDVVFVVAPPEKVITVFKYDRNNDASNA